MSDRVSAKGGWSSRKRAILAMAVGLMNVVGLTAIASLWARWVLLLAAMVALAVGVYLLSLKCARCGTRMYKRRMRFLGEEFVFWGGVLPKRCSECGAKL